MQRLLPGGRDRRAPACCDEADVATCRRQRGEPQRHLTKSKPTTLLDRALLNVCFHELRSGAIDPSATFAAPNYFARKRPIGSSGRYSRGNHRQAVALLCIARHRRRLDHGRGLSLKVWCAGVVPNDGDSRSGSTPEFAGRCRLSILQRALKRDDDGVGGGPNTARSAPRGQSDADFHQPRRQHGRR